MPATADVKKNTAPGDRPDAGSDQNSPTLPEDVTGIRILLADSQAIYRVGIRKIFAVEDDMRVVAQAENYPGLLAAGTIGLAATWLAQHYTAPVMLFALLFGMAFHFLHEEGRCVAGIEFASRSVLRLGVGLLGVRITLSQIASLGPWPVVTVIVGVSTTILIGFLLARRMGLSSMFGVLSGGAVAICS